MKKLLLSLTVLAFAALPLPAQPVIKIASNIHHSLLIKSDGSLWILTGTGNEDLSGSRPEKIVDSGVTAVAVGIDHSFIVKNDGSLWAMGNNGGGYLGDGTYNDANRPVQIVPSGVTEVSAGDNFTLFLKDDGSMWAFGGNEFCQLGDGTSQVLELQRGEHDEQRTGRT